MHYILKHFIESIELVKREYDTEWQLIDALLQIPVYDVPLLQEGDEVYDWYVGEVKACIDDITEEEARDMAYDMLVRDCWNCAVDQTGVPQCVKFMD